MNIWVLIGVSLLVLIIIVLLIVFNLIKKRRIKYVKQTSSKIKNIEEINNATKFYDPINSWDYTYHCNSLKEFRSCNYDKVQRAFYSEFFNEIIEANAQLEANKSTNVSYIKDINKILDSKTSLPENSKLKESKYVKIEQKIIDKIILKPKTESVITLDYEYTSPAGRNHYESNQKTLSASDFIDEQKETYIRNKVNDAIMDTWKNPKYRNLMQSSFKEQRTIMMNPKTGGRDNFIINISCRISILEKFVSSFEYIDKETGKKLDEGKLYKISSKKFDMFISDIKTLLNKVNLYEDYNKALEYLNSVKDIFKDNDNIRFDFSNITKARFADLQRVFTAKFACNEKSELEVSSINIGVISNVDNYLKENPDSPFKEIVDWVTSKIDEINKLNNEDKLIHLEANLLHKTNKHLRFQFVETTSTQIVINLKTTNDKNTVLCKLNYFNNNKAVPYEQALIQSLDNEILKYSIKIGNEVNSLNRKSNNREKMLIALAKVYEKYESHDFDSNPRQRLTLKFDKSIKESDVWFKYFKLRPDIKPLNISKLRDGIYKCNPLIKSKMRNYQYKAFNWCNLMISNNLSGILADDMGLGKTLEIISIIEAQKDNLPNLIVCPASLLYNWQAEFKKWAPNEKVQILRRINNKYLSVNNVASKRINLIVTYNFMVANANELSKLRFNFIVLDEAQYIKNRDTSRTAASKLLISNFRFALTGTPIENKEDDLWSIFEFLMPDLFEKYQLEKLCKDAKREYIKPFILRRRKKDVLSELPPKNEITIKLEMNEKQKDFYSTYKEQNIDINDEYLALLAQITRLRQICVDTRILDSSSKIPSVKIEYLNELLDTIIKSDESVLVYSFFASEFKFLEKELRSKNIKFVKLDGQTPLSQRENNIELFNTDSSIHVFLISLKAGGVGLNLTKANNVVFLDPWWNIATESQAADRTHRIGQRKTVNVYRLICKDTIEERVLDIQSSKLNIINYFIENEETAHSEKLSKDLLKEILTD